LCKKQTKTKIPLITLDQLTATIYSEIDCPVSPKKEK
jgi:hypothetical protein